MSKRAINKTNATERGQRLQQTVRPPARLLQEAIWGKVHGNQLKKGRKGK